MLTKIKEPTLESVHVIIKDRFGFIYLDRRSKQDISFLSDISLYRRKQERRDKRGVRFRKDEGYNKLLQWIFGIQKHFGWTDEEFGTQLGYTNRRMIQCFKRFEGSLPSRKVLLRLFELEKLAKVRITEGECKNVTNRQ